MANREKMESAADFIFLGFKITANGDCSHEIKRHLLLGRKAMTNLDGILKSRDITLPTKVRLVKAIVLWCKSWTIKKAEHRRIDAFELWCWRRLLRVPWTARRSNQSILKISPECSLEGLMLNMMLQYFGHLMWRNDSLKKTLMLGKIQGRSRRERQRMRWLDGITNSMDMSLSKLWKVGDGQGSPAFWFPWGRKELDMTEQLNWLTDVFPHVLDCLYCSIVNPECREYLVSLVVFSQVLPSKLNPAHNVGCWMFEST